jgi:hypothetical protein
MREPGPTRSLNARNARLLLFLATRLAFASLFLLTSVYCLLVYIPFAYFGFIRHPLMPWIPAFVRLQPYLLCAVLLLLASTLTAEFRTATTRRSAAAFVLLNLFFCAYEILFRRGLSAQSPGIFSYVWSLLAVLPLLWLAAIDMAESNIWNSLESSTHRENQTPAGAILAAFAVAIAFAGTAILRQILSRNPVSPPTVLAGFAASLGFHLLIFAAFGAALYAFALLARRTSWPNRIAVILPCLLACYLGAQIIRGMILPAISFEGWQADIFSVTISCALVFYTAAIVPRLRLMTAGTTDDTAPRRLSWRSASVAMLLLCVIAYAIPGVLGPTDWDFVLQQTAVIAVWAATLAFIHRYEFSISRRALKVGAIAALVVAVAAVGWRETARSEQESSDNWTSLLDEYSGADISFKTTRAILSRSVRNDAYDAFYEFLKRNTNLRQPVGPLQLSLAPDLESAEAAKPHIFLFVIDSLRQDYISAYNPALDFTPEIGKFAQDSIVLRNAFTRYGGTALSEPAIWSGAMQPHKQFVKPFYPMNNLQNLIEAEGYQCYISVDPILQEILRPSSSTIELDQGTKAMSEYEYAVTVKGVNPNSIARSEQNTKSWSTLDFVATLRELESKIAARTDKSKPIFAYTQPQNVHTVNLERSQVGGTRREISIHELRRMDAAFGEFVRFLQAQGLYEQSIIILTSDHGDAYGEFGRFGHSDFIFPEVMRIPLVIHLPPSMRQNVVWDARQIAFSLDITPSLYYLLGHRPTLNNELFGRPLFTATLAEQAPYLRSHYLIASSYAPVYGILADNGGTLFIVDAVNRKNYFYALSTDPEGIHNHVTPQIRDENESRIRDQIATIDRAYGVTPDQ